MLKLNDKLVLFGFEAEGYYTGNFEKDKCLVRKKDFDNIKTFINIPEDLDIYEFDELDGKHAHVEGEYVEEFMTVEQFIRINKEFPYQWLVEDTFPEDYNKNKKIDIFSNEYRENLENEINECRKEVMVTLDLNITIPANKKDELLDFIKNLN